MKNKTWVLAISAAGCLALASCQPAQRAGANASTESSTRGGTATTDAHAFASGTTNNLTKQGKRGTPNQR